MYRSFTSISDTADMVARNACTFVTVVPREKMSKTVTAILNTNKIRGMIPKVRIVIECNTEGGICFLCHF